MLNNLRLFVFLLMLIFCIPQSVFADWKLPFPEGDRQVLTRGFHTPPTHVRRDQFALDFTKNGCDGFGTPVVATEDGVIEFVNTKDDWGGGYGRNVVIAHDDIQSRYAHLDTYGDGLVAGMTIEQGTLVGYQGNTGNVAGVACPEYPGTHLHFVYRKENQAYEPIEISGYTEFVPGRWYVSDNGARDRYQDTVFSTHQIRIVGKPGERIEVELNIAGADILAGALSLHILGNVEAYDEIKTDDWLTDRRPAIVRSDGNVSVVVRVPDESMQREFLLVQQHGSTFDRAGNDAVTFVFDPVYSDISVDPVFVSFADIEELPWIRSRDVLEEEILVDSMQDNDEEIEIEDPLFQPSIADPSIPQVPVISNPIVAPIFVPAPRSSVLPVDPIPPPLVFAGGTSPAQPVVIAEVEQNHFVEEEQKNDVLSEDDIVFLFVQDVVSSTLVTEHHELVLSGEVSPEISRIVARFDDHEEEVSLLDQQWNLDLELDQPTTAITFMLFQDDILREVHEIVVEYAPPVVRVPELPIHFPTNTVFVASSSWYWDISFDDQDMLVVSTTAQVRQEQLTTSSLRLYIEEEEKGTITFWTTFEDRMSSSTHLSFTLDQTPPELSSVLWSASTSSVFVQALATDQDDAALYQYDVFVPIDPQPPEFFCEEVDEEIVLYEEGTLMHLHETLSRLTDMPCTWFRIDTQDPEVVFSFFEEIQFGEVYLRVRAVDALGNPSPWVYSEQITFEEPVVREGNILISEIAWAGTVAQAQDEWIELWNRDDFLIDLNGWMLEWGYDEETQAFAQQIVLNQHIPVHGVIVLERTDQGTVRNVQGTIYQGGLANSGEWIRLVRYDGVVQESVDARAGWFAGNAETKETMVRIHPYQPAEDALNWCTYGDCPVMSLRGEAFGQDVQGNMILGSPDSVEEIIQQL
jgi:hypothetical protein